MLRKEFVRASGLEITAFVECIIIHTSLSSLKFQHFSVGAIVNRFQILSLPFEQKLDSKFGRFLPCKQDFGAISYNVRVPSFYPYFLNKNGPDFSGPSIWSYYSLENLLASFVILEESDELIKALRP